MKETIKTLVVDDELQIVKAIERYMTFYDKIELFTASNYEEALEIIRREEPRIIITDVDLNGNNGLKLIAEGKKYTNATQVIIITGGNNTTLVVDALELGAVDYIRKPLNVEELKDRVEEACDRVQRWEEAFRFELHKSKGQQLSSIHI